MGEPPNSDGVRITYRLPRGLRQSHVTGEKVTVGPSEIEVQAKLALELLPVARTSSAEGGARGEVAINQPCLPEHPVHDLRSVKSNRETDGQIGDPKRH